MYINQGDSSFVTSDMLYNPMILISASSFFNDFKPSVVPSFIIFSIRLRFITIVIGYNTSLAIFYKTTFIITEYARFLLNGKLLADSVLYFVYAVTKHSHPFTDVTISKNKVTFTKICF